MTVLGPDTSLLEYFSALKDPRQSLRCCFRCRRSCCWCWARRWPEPRISSRFKPGARCGWRSCAASCPSATASLPRHPQRRDQRARRRAVQALLHHLGRDVARPLEPEFVAIDGKTSRRSHARGKGREPLHLVSAWASRQRLVLGQQAVGGQSNEITAIPLLLERLELTGALVTIDAIGCQTKIAQAILASRRTTCSR